MVERFQNSDNNCMRFVFLLGFIVPLVLDSNITFVLIYAQ